LHPFLWIPALHYKRDVLLLVMFFLQRSKFSTKNEATLCGYVYSNIYIPGVSSTSMKCSSSGVEVSSGNSNNPRRAVKRGALEK
jgi:hypothetical protein